MNNAINVLNCVKCPSCGSSKIIFETSLKDVEFWIEEGEIKSYVQWRIKNNILNGEYVLCVCNDCGENWSLYSEDEDGE